MDKTIPKAPHRVLTVEEFINSDADHFAPNAFDLADAKIHLLRLDKEAKVLGGAVYVEEEMLEEIGGLARNRPHYDTMYIVLPPLDRLPAMIHRYDREYVRIASTLYADEKDIIDKPFPKEDSYRTYDDSYNKKLNPEKNIVIRLWWD